jgi:hypothetical protein
MQETLLLLHSSTTSPQAVKLVLPQSITIVMIALHHGIRVLESQAHLQRIKGDCLWHLSVKVPTCYW